MTDNPTYGDLYLAHHGIKGMKWGKRRAASSESDSSGSSSSSTTDTATSVKKPRKVTGKTEVDDGKDVTRMSDKELRERINRINMEQQYSKLTEPSYPPVKSGMDFVNQGLNLANKANQAYAIWNSPLGKLGREFVKDSRNNRRANSHGLSA